MSRRITWIILIIAGTLLLAIFASMVYFYIKYFPAYESIYNLIWILLCLAILILGIIFVWTSYRIYFKHRKPIFFRTKKRVGMQVIATGIIFAAAPFFMYYSGYKNPFIWLLLLIAAYLVYGGYNVCKGKKMPFMKKRIKVI